MLRKGLIAVMAFALQFGASQLLAADAAAPVPTQAPAAAPTKPKLSVDKTALDNGGVITITGKAAPGKPVFIEVYNENRVKGSFFDNKPNKEGKIPYKLYLSEEIPAFYKILLPTSQQPLLDKLKKEGKGWAYAGALKESGADAVYSNPAKGAIDGYQTSLMASLVGSRGDQLPALDDKERARRSMQIVKAKFQSVGSLLAASVDQKEDGSFTAKVTIPDGVAPGQYFITAATAKNEKSEPVIVENKIAFPMLYLDNAGSSINIFLPFIITLLIATLGVLCGFGGAFMLNPLLIMGFGMPHAVVAGTVMPTVLFSQASGIMNYSKINFISWKVGLIMGAAMLAGGFIGPALTELVSLDQFKFMFGWILVVIVALMFYQTTPGYIAKNKKEQAILKEFQKRAAEAAAKNA